MSLTLGSGVVYAVFPNEDLTSKRRTPSMTLDLAPKRRTIKWRGRKFNVPTVRVVRVGFTSALTLEMA